MCAPVSVYLHVYTCVHACVCTCVWYTLCLYAWVHMQDLCDVWSCMWYVPCCAWCLFPGMFVHMFGVCYRQPSSDIFQRHTSNSAFIMSHASLLKMWQGTEYTSTHLTISQNSGQENACWILKFYKNVNLLHKSQYTKYKEYIQQINLNKTSFNATLGIQLFLLTSLSWGAKLLQKLD